MLTIWLMLCYVRMSWAIVGYDCSGNNLNITTVSLNEIGDCDTEQLTTMTEQTYIQLLQLSEFNYVDVIQCKVEIARTIHYCGMHSHISAVQNGINQYLETTTEEECNQMHQFGIFHAGRNTFLYGLKTNTTVTRPFTMAGKLNIDGTCHGADFSDPYGSWENVVVQATATITIRASSVPVRLEANKVILKSGTICGFQSGTCLDNEDGYTYWKPFPVSTCKFDQYDVLYEGLASKITETLNQQPTPSVFALTTKEITFAFTKTGEMPICGYTLFQTEHPKLFILETNKGNTFTTAKRTRVENFDIFTYINSKFVYIEKHIKTQMTTLYRNLLKQKCDLEKQVLTNALTLATLKPDEFAQTVTKLPGHMALVAGEVIHIIKCIPVNVQVRHAQECYNELPVTHNNRTMFLTPKTRILSNHGTQRDCSHVLPVMYEIDQSWHKLLPRPTETVPPQVLQPLKEPIWRYINPLNLATSGIYTQKDLNNLRDHIMFPAEKAAIINSMARTMTGKNIPSGTLSLMDMINEDTLNQIAENAATKFWNGFLRFGSVSAGLIGIFIIFRIFKTIVDTIIQGYQIHSTYGCGLHLCGAAWSSITHLLLHRASKHKYQVDADNDPEPTSVDCQTQTSRPDTAERRAAIRNLEQISLRNLLSKGEGVTSRD
ncbi:uncharacterized protein LOC143263387 [Megalopta genalis]|uniref:uncharacterized protein LOC143263386 n=1 Tax=Megalopta genalis TaxID=115081 RepID=UPI003FD637C8